jgi:hypothetical protein
MARLEKPIAIKMKVPMLGTSLPPERIKVATVAMPIETEAAAISVVVGEPDFRFMVPSCQSDDPARPLEGNVGVVVWGSSASVNVLALDASEHPPGVDRGRPILPRAASMPKSWTRLPGGDGRAVRVEDELGRISRRKLGDVETVELARLGDEPLHELVVGVEHLPE